MYYVQICLQKERKNKMGEIIHEMITEKQITDRIREMAEQISKD